jgi:alpha-beta hydrolase superfamily lysophospholipase
VSAIGTPEPDSQDTLTTPDGTELHLERFVPRGAARAVVVFAHGFTPHAGVYRHVGAALAREGLAVTSYDARGHGRSGGRRGHIARAADYTEDMAAVAGAARGRLPELPWALVAHSMGALVALDHLLSDRPRPACAVLAAPWLETAMKVPWYKAAAAPLLARLLPALALPHGLSVAEACRTPEVIRGFTADDLVVRVATPRWFIEMRAAQARLRAAAKTLRVPSLMLLAGQDRIVGLEAALAFAREAGDVVEVRSYADLYHEVFLEPERDRVIADTAAWLLEKARGLTSGGPRGVQSPAILSRSP